MRIMFYYPPASPSILSYDTKILQFSQKHFQQKKDLSKYPARKCECKNKLKEQGGEQETGKIKLREQCNIKHAQTADICMVKRF